MAERSKPPHPDDDPSDWTSDPGSRFQTLAGLALGLVDHSPSLMFSVDGTAGLAAWLSDGYIPLDQVGPIRAMIDDSDYPDGIPSTSLRFKSFGVPDGANEAAEALKIIDRIRKFLDEIEDIANDAAVQIDEERSEDSD